MMLPNTSEGQDEMVEVSRAEKTGRARTWREHLCILIPILMIYLSLAFYRIDHQSLWTDEAISVMRAEPTGPLLTRERWLSGQSPPYFLLLHLWAKWWGTSELALRFLSALLGAIVVGLAYVTALRLCNSQMAWIAATLLATSPFLIWYSQEVRYVIFMILTALVATYTFERLLFTRRLGWWLCYCGSLMLAIFSFAVNVFLPMAHGLYLMCASSRGPVLRRWVTCQLVVLAFFIWLMNDGQIWQLGGAWQRLFAHMTTNSENLPVMESVEALSAGGSRQFTVMALPYTFFAFSTGFSLGPSLPELHVSQSLATLLPHAVIPAIAGLLFGTLFTLGLVALRRQSDTAKFLATWLAMPILGVLSVSWLIPSLAYNVRYVAMSFPAYILTLALGIASVRRPLTQIMLLSGVLSVSGLSLVNYYHNPRYSREDARSAARYLEAETLANDVIVLVGNTTALEHYYSGSPPILGWGAKVIGNHSALTDHLRKLYDAYERVWLVAIRPWEADPEGTVKAALDAESNFIVHKTWPGVDVYLYPLSPMPPRPPNGQRNGYP